MNFRQLFLAGRLFWRSKPRFRYNFDVFLSFSEGLYLRGQQALSLNFVACRIERTSPERSVLRLRAAQPFDTVSERRTVRALRPPLRTWQL